MNDPVSVTVPKHELAKLCELAKQAGEDLQLTAMSDHKGDHPAMARRRNREMERAQDVIDTAFDMSKYVQS